MPVRLIRVSQPSYCTLRNRNGASFCRRDRLGLGSWSSSSPEFFSVTSLSEEESVDERPSEGAVPESSDDRGVVDSDGGELQDRKEKGENTILMDAFQSINSEETSNSEEVSEFQFTEQKSTSEIILAI